MFRLTASLSGTARTPAQFLLLAGVLLLPVCPVRAEHQDPVVPMIAVGTTGTAARIDEEEPDAGRLNFEMEFAVPVSAGHFSFLLEAEAAPPDPAACPVQTDTTGNPFLATSNGARLVEMLYRVSHASGEWAVGFIEARSYLDASTVANDDKTQFGLPAFVNNPTIGLPGSRLGLSWRRSLDSGRHGIAALVSRDEHAGVFLAAESWQAFEPLVARLGAWQGRSEIDCGEDPHEAMQSRGWYAGLDGQVADLHWNLRAGIGKHGPQSVSFLGVAVELPLAGGSIGLAAGQGRAAAHGGPALRRHAELYWRFHLPGGLMILPGISLNDRVGDDRAAELAAGLRFGFNI